MKCQHMLMACQRNCMFKSDWVTDSSQSLIMETVKVHDGKVRVSDWEILFSRFVAMADLSSGPISYPVAHHENGLVARWKLK